MTTTGEFNPYQAPTQPLEPATGLPGPRPWVRAPLWRRFFAALVDLAIGMVCCALGAMLVLPLLFFDDHLRLNTNDPLNVLPFVVFGFVIVLCVYGPFFAYFILMESSRRKATFGKYLLDLAVVRTDGKRLNFRRSTVRTMTKTVGIMLYGLGLFWMFFNRDRQALHDRVADTVVVLRNEREIVVTTTPH